MTVADAPVAPRYLVAWLPAFRLERCGLAASDVAALVDEVKSAVRIVSATPAALELGLRPGVTATEARALAPDVQLLPVDPVGEREDRAALLRAAEAVSDRVVFAWDDALVAEISLTTSALGGERAVVERARTLLASFGHELRLAVADDPLAALGLATGRVGDDGYLHPPGLPLGDLLLLALRPSEGLRDAFRVVGLRTCAELAALSASSVAGRYGAEGLRLYRVARGAHVGLGDVEDVGSDDEIRVSTALAGATTRGELLFALPGLLALLVQRLAAQDLAVVRLRVVLGLDTPQDSAGGRRVGSIRLGRPTRSIPRLERAIRARLDTLVTDPGSELPATPIDELRLEVEEAAPEVGWQPGLTDRAEHREPLPDLLSRLADQLGPDAVFRAVPAAVWRPEASWRAAAFPAPTLVSGRRPRPGGRPDDAVDEQEHREHTHPLPRPALLLERPERLEVVVDGGGPARVRLPVSTLGDRDAPTWLPVVRRAGPERLYGEWWTPTVLDREYWVVELEARAAWIFRDPAGAWSLHGWFD
jgi:protein ImuB